MPPLNATAHILERKVTILAIRIHRNSSWVIFSTVPGTQQVLMSGYHDHSQDAGFPFKVCPDFRRRCCLWEMFTKWCTDLYSNFFGAKTGKKWLSV